MSAYKVKFVKDFKYKGSQIFNLIKKKYVRD